jgi:hypothetical protein
MVTLRKISASDMPAKRSVSCSGSGSRSGSLDVLGERRRLAPLGDELPGCDDACASGCDEARADGVPLGGAGAGVNRGDAAGRFSGGSAGTGIGTVPDPACKLAKALDQLT